MSDSPTTPAPAKQHKAWAWTKQREDAAALIAEGEKTMGQIAKQVKISLRQLTTWKRHPEFAERIQQLTDNFAAMAMQYSIGRRVTRLSEMDRRWRRLKQIVNERAASVEYQGVPGGETGLLMKLCKTVGSGRTAVEREEFVLDANLLREMREIEEGAGRLLGQIVIRTDLSSGGQPLPPTVIELRELPPRSADGDAAEPALCYSTGDAI
jgi:hypothetical protein